MSTELEIGRRVRTEAGFGLVKTREGSREYEQLGLYAVMDPASRSVVVCGLWDLADVEQWLDWWSEGGRAVRRRGLGPRRAAPSAEARQARLDAVLEELRGL